MVAFDILVETDTWILTLLLFVFMVIGVISGNYFGKRSDQRSAERKGDSLMTAGIYTLVGLLMAFSFSMAGSRFDSRKKIIIEEANDIGTALLRSNLYPDSITVLFKEDFKKYIDARILYFESRTDIPRALASMDTANKYGTRIFMLAARYAMEPGYVVPSQQMVPAVNAMLDIANTRFHDELYKVPSIIIFLIVVLSFISSFIYGYTARISGKRIDWLLSILYTLIFCLVFYFMLDLDRPRRGLINLDETNKAIINLKSMTE